MSVEKGHLYKLIPAGKKDFDKVNQLYLKAPVNGLKVGTVEIIHNPTVAATFDSRAKTLNGRAGNEAFKPKWVSDNNNLEHRKEVYSQFKQNVSSDVLLPAVKFVQGWAVLKKSDQINQKIVSL